MCNVVISYENLNQITLLILILINYRILIILTKKKYSPENNPVQGLE